jgi:hypothetical protein
LACDFLQGDFVHANDGSTPIAFLTRIYLPRFK